MNQVLAAALVIVGTGFMLLSAFGVLRMPDVYMRLQVASKASSLGAGCLMIGVALHFEDLGIAVRAILIVIFIFLTTPVSAHLIGRAAYITGVRQWAGSGVDELRGAYDPRQGTLRGEGWGRGPGEGEEDPAGIERQALDEEGPAPEEGSATDGGDPPARDQREAD